MHSLRQDQHSFEKRGSLTAPFVVMKYGRSRLQPRLHLSMTIFACIFSPCPCPLRSPQSHGHRVGPNERQLLQVQVPMVALLALTACKRPKVARRERLEAVVMRVRFSALWGISGVLTVLLGVAGALDFMVLGFGLFVHPFRALRLRLAPARKFLRSALCGCGDCFALVLLQSYFRGD